MIHEVNESDAMIDSEVKKFLQILSKEALECVFIEFAHKKIHSEGPPKHITLSFYDFFEFLDNVNMLYTSDNNILSFRFRYTRGRTLSIDLLTGILTIENSVDLISLEELAAADLIGKDKFIEEIQITFTF